MKQPEDQHTGELQLARRGRPPIGEAAMTAAQRQAAKRQKKADTKARTIGALVELAGFVQQLERLSSSDRETILTAVDLIAKDISNS